MIDVTGFNSMANMLADERVDIWHMAKEFKCSPRTVQRYVQRGQLPPPIRFGRRSLWVVKRVREWIEKRSDAAEAEAEREAQRLKNYSYRAR